MGVIGSFRSARAVHGLKQSAWVYFCGFELASRIDREKWLFIVPKLFFDEFLYQKGIGYYENQPMLTSREKAKLKAIEKRLLSMDF